MFIYRKSTWREIKEEERQGIKNFKGYKSEIYEEKLYFSFVLRKFILFCNNYTINVSEHVFCQHCSACEVSKG